MFGVGFRAEGGVVTVIVWLGGRSDGLGVRDGILQLGADRLRGVVGR